MRCIIGSVTFAVLMTLSSCSAEKQTPNEPDQQHPAQPTVGQLAEVHDVMCGCSIEGVGKCGNYIKIDGKYVPMVHPTLGKMQWCSQKGNGAKVKTVGTVMGDKFVAVTWQTVE